MLIFCWPGLFTCIGLVVSGPTWLILSSRFSQVVNLDASSISASLLSLKSSLLAPQSGAHIKAPHKDPNPITIQPNPTHPTYSSRVEKRTGRARSKCRCKAERYKIGTLQTIFSEEKNVCRSLRKFRNCIKNVAKPQH